MSIIYDALNKAESKHINNKQSPGSNRLFIIVGIAASIVVLASLVFLFKKRVYISRRKYHRRTVKGEVKYAEKKYTSGSFILEGIIYDKGVPTAIINGKVLKEGDIISGLRVGKIHKDNVQLFVPQDNKEILLTF